MLGHIRKCDRGKSIRKLPQEDMGGSGNWWRKGTTALYPCKVRRPVVLVMGDSHTQGMYGANYVEVLQARFPAFRLVNAGRNGEVLESIRRRTIPLLQAFGGDVVGVVILGGTNDCLANLNASTRALIRLYNPFLRELPLLSEYTKILHDLLGTIYAHEVSSYIDICCVTPPMIAECPDSLENKLVDSVCDEIRATVRRITHKRREKGVENVVTQENKDADGRMEVTTGAGFLLPPALSSSELPKTRWAGGKTEERDADDWQHEQGHRHWRARQGHHRSTLTSLGPPHPRRRLHCLDFNMHMKRHLEEVIADKPRKAFEPDFFNMCFNSGVSLVSGSVLKWDSVSAARGLALHNDGVHMNERAIGPLVDALGLWLEALQEELYMRHTREAYASAITRSCASNTMPYPPVRADKAGGDDRANFEYAFPETRNFDRRKGQAVEKPEYDEKVEKGVQAADDKSPRS